MKHKMIDLPSQSLMLNFGKNEFMKFEKSKKKINLLDTDIHSIFFFCKPSSVQPEKGTNRACTVVFIFILLRKRTQSIQFIGLFIWFLFLSQRPRGGGDGETNLKYKCQLHVKQMEKQKIRRKKIQKETLHLYTTIKETEKEAYKNIQSKNVVFTKTIYNIIRTHLNWI